MRILPDSGAYSHLKRVHPRVAELVRISEEVLPSLAVVGELLYGFRNRSRLEKNVHELHAFLDSPRVTIAAMSLGTADRRSGIAASLRAKGRPVPSSDIRSAARAMGAGAGLVPHDRHFEQIEGFAWTCVPADASLAGARRWTR